MANELEAKRTENELEQEEAGELPDDEPKWLINANLSAPVSAAVAPSVADD